MKSHEIKLGDTCVMDILLGAGNNDHQYFRHEDPILELSNAGGRSGSVTIAKKETLGWRAWFMPSKVGADSVVGRIRMPDQRGYADTTDLPFASYYKVVPR